MALLDFILNIVGLLLWFNWRAARYDPVSRSTPATLAGTLRRAESSPLRRWHFPFGLLMLLLLRAPLYAEIGGALNWIGRVNVGVISIPFYSSVPSYLTMLLYSFYSFGVALTVFLLAILLLSALKTGAPENDSLRQLLHLHLGPVERWPAALKLLLPWCVITAVWYGASWPLTHLEILPQPNTPMQRLEQAMVVGAGSYLAWKPFLIALLGLHFINGYVYFGKSPFWQHLELVGQKLLTPLRRMPLRMGALNLAPVAGILIVLAVSTTLEKGIVFPWKKNSGGPAAAPWINVPGLVDLYRRVSE